MIPVKNLKFVLQNPVAEDASLYVKVDIVLGDAETGPLVTQHGWKRTLHWWEFSWPPKRSSVSEAIITVGGNKSTTVTVDLHAPESEPRTRYTAVMTVGWTRDGKPVLVEEDMWEIYAPFTLGVEQISQKQTASIDQSIDMLAKMYQPSIYGSWNWSTQAGFASSLLLHPKKSGLDRLRLLCQEVDKMRSNARGLGIDTSKLEASEAELLRIFDVKGAHVRSDIIKESLNILVPDRDLGRMLGKEAEFFFELDESTALGLFSSDFAAKIEGTRYRISKINAEASFLPTAIQAFNKRVDFLRMIIYNYLAQAKYVVEATKTIGKNAA